jgi:hypothetical protein
MRPPQLPWSVKQLRSLSRHPRSHQLLLCVLVFILYTESCFLTGIDGGQMCNVGKVGEQASGLKSRKAMFLLSLTQV